MMAEWRVSPQNNNYSRAYFPDESPFGTPVGPPKYYHYDTMTPQNTPHPTTNNTAQDGHGAPSHFNFSEMELALPKTEAPPPQSIVSPLNSPLPTPTAATTKNINLDLRAVKRFCNEIFIGNLPKNLTRDEIYKQLRNYDLGNGLHLYIKQFKQPRCTARRDAKGVLILNVGYAFIVTKTRPGE